MHSNPKNMKELCAYAIHARRQRASEHRRLALLDGKCSGLTDKEYNRVVISQKSNFSKAKKFTHNRYWKETSRKFEVNELKLIKKTL